MARLFAISILFHLATAPALAQGLPFPLEVPAAAGVTYRADIPRPENVIGHTVGTRHTAPHQVVEYFRAVDAASERVVVREHGRTHEGRPLLHAVVTAPGNHARLESIRTANLRLSEEPERVDEAMLAAQPAVVYMGYSIHGDEASGTEAALLLLYHLAAAEDAFVERLLEETVILVDPLLNPDGRDRFTDWVNRHRGGVPNADPNDLEHRQPWPRGRTNHYWFDLNRDWLPATQPASQARLALFHHWRPQLLTDYHEMERNATFFFQPGIPSRNNPNTPARTFDLTDRIASYHAAALDEMGALYYTRESFDDFYYGKGSTYPDVNGAVGILFEQASSRALVTESDHGELTYAATIRNPFTASLSTLRAALALRTELLRHQRDFYAEAPEVARSAPEKAFVVALDRDRTRAELLAQLLQRHRIRLYQLARDVEAGGDRYRAGEAYVVPVDQPQARLVLGIMQRQLAFEDSLFYDVSTWTLPLAYGVTYAGLEVLPRGMIGPSLDAVALGGGRVVGGAAGYGYVFPWGGYFAPRALYELQEAGIRTYLLPSAVTIRSGGETVALPRGSVVVPLGGQHVAADDVHALARRAAEVHHLTVYAVDTGLTPEGPDLGSRSLVPLQQPVVGLVVGQGASAYAAGEVWHLLSERFAMPVSLLDADALRGADLDRYTTIVMAGGSYGDVPAERIRAWVQGGGHLVALGRAAEWAARNDFVALTADDTDFDSLLVDVPFETLPDARGAHEIGGAIFSVQLDETHPLAFGYGERVPVFRDHTLFFQPAGRPGVDVGRYAADPLVSGYLSPARRTQAAGKAAIVAERVGRGRVVVMLDNPNFRGFWYGTNGLFLNALFLSDAF